MDTDFQIKKKIKKIYIRKLHFWPNIWPAQQEIFHQPNIDMQCNLNNTINTMLRNEYISIDDILKDQIGKSRFAYVDDVIILLGYLDFVGQHENNMRNRFSLKNVSNTLDQGIQRWH